ncbi:response regulator transcription factor [Peribacillus acanthi]|uniref:response regulator transcription factor n=1 Tax=Peribacillus acanthi TaxID=2171554 RepID=UPI000D3E2FA5|nr:response regulator transcription factor [Peribacillus acanthi]
MVQHSILVVEDDKEIATILVKFLRERDYQVTWASTGNEGWEDFKSGKYDMAIIDLMLPGMDGFTLCQNIRWSSQIPMLILSARHEEDDKVRGLKIGADDYMTKPFSLRELGARVESQLRRYGRYQEEIHHEDMLEYDGGLTIYPEKKEVILNSNSISLTSKEFSLLLLFCQNPQHAFTKKELYEHIWQQQEVSGNNTVTVHIKSLRDKLKDPLKNPLFIQTLWGQGYRFVGVPKK